MEEKYYDFDNEINFFKKVDLFLEYDYQLEEFAKTVKKYGYKFEYKNKSYGVDAYLIIKNKKTNRKMKLRFNNFGFILYSDYEKIILDTDEKIHKVFEVFKLNKLYKMVM